MIKVVSKFRLSLQMKRYNHATKMEWRHLELWKKHERLFKKWNKKVRYYRKLFENDDKQ